MQEVGRGDAAIYEGGCMTKFAILVKQKRDTEVLNVSLTASKESAEWQSLKKNGELSGADHLRLINWQGKESEATA